MINVTFLGSGCWQGIPAPFGDDAISKNVKWDTKDFRFRTSLFIETKNGKKIIVEATPDIRLQSWKFQIGKPDAILISHWHWDHLFGLLDIAWYAEKNKFYVYANTVTKKWYDSQMGHVPVDFRLCKPNESFEIDNIRITPIMVDHVEETNGFLFEDTETKKKFAYFSDLHGIPPQTAEIVKGIDAIVTDATYLESDLVDDPTHLHNHQIIPFLKKLTAKEIILTNIGSYQGLTHVDLKKKYPDYTIAFDGMKRSF